MQNCKIGFDNNKFLREQAEHIFERVEKFGGKLYLEIGGKIMHDYHASRVLPGFDPDVKMRLLQELKDKADIILCLHANDIKGRTIRGDFGITSDLYLLKMIDDLRSWDIDVSAVVITRFQQQEAAEIFKNKLERRGIKVYTHKIMEGYPNLVDKIVSDKGFGLNLYIETQKPLVIVAAPAPDSGKLATCLSQIYHDYKKGIKSGYAKFETFPVWNLPLKHPVNMAYEASTADIGDVNLIDPFHLEAYGKTAVNYNRDVEIFPVIKKILQKISAGREVYNSPTDMGVNRVGFAVINDNIIKETSRQEIIRRFFRYSCEYVKGIGEKETVDRVKLLMEELNIIPENRAVVKPARAAAEEAKIKKKGHKGVFSGAAIQLENGRIITGKNSALMHASVSLFLNTIKTLADIPDKIHLLSPQIINSISKFKGSVSGVKNLTQLNNFAKGEIAVEQHLTGLSLNLEEALIALSITASTSSAVEVAMSKIKQLKGCEVHLTHIPKPGDENSWRKLQVNLTSDPQFSSKVLYVRQDSN